MYSRNILFFGLLFLVILGGWWLWQTPVPREAGSVIGEENRFSEESQEAQPIIRSESLKAAENATDLPLALPGGFRLEVFVSELSGPRTMLFDPVGTLLLSLPSAGQVVALKDEDNDGKADAPTAVLRGLNNPHGLATHCEGEACRLYVGEENAVAMYEYDAVNIRATNRQMIADLPSGRGHSSRNLTLASLGGEDKLFVSIGSSCNVCREADNRRAKVFVSDLDGKNFRPFVTGLRNPVFLATHPATGEIWVTEMGRDYLGDNLPPDEVNILEDGRDYGWPYCYGKNVHDDTFDPRKTVACAEPDKVPSHIDIQAHSAPLGLAFVPQGSGWSEEYANDLLVAYHGSWNRSAPTGYKVVRYHLDSQGKVLGQEDFISGWLTSKGEVLGRPVDLKFAPDGSLYISDDKRGVIYRITPP